MTTVPIDRPTPCAVTVFIFIFSLLACAPAQANSVTHAKLNRFHKPPLRGRLLSAKPLAKT